MYDDIRDFINKSTSHIPSSDSLLIRQEVPDVSLYDTSEIFYIVNDCIETIISYMRKNRTNPVVEEKLEYFFRFFEQCSDDIKNITVNLLFQKYNITDETFHLEKWKKLYNQYRS